MKHLLLIGALLASLQAHASVAAASHGHHGTLGGRAHGQAQASTSNSGNGGVDGCDVTHYVLCKGE